MNKKYSGIIAIACLVIMCFSTFVGCGTAELKTVKVCEVAHTIFYSPQYSAISQGFFEEEGLSVELSTGNGADKVTAAVLSGDADIGFAGVEGSIYVYSQGKEDHLISFAQLTKRDGSFLVSREQSDKFNFEDVKGKMIIAGRSGGMPEMSLEWVLRQNNVIPYKDVELDNSIQFPAMAGAFIGGTGDYVALFEPAALAVEKEGRGFVVASIGQESGELPYTAYGAKKSYIEENPDTIQSFTNAVAKGLKWVEENDAQTVATAILEFFPETSMNDLTAVVQRYKDIDAWKSEPKINEEDFLRMQEIMTAAGQLDKTIPFDKLVDNQFAEKVFK